MKFKNYLNEEIDIDVVYNILIRDCGSFIKEWKKIKPPRFLLSGRRSYNGDFKKFYTRIDRRPTDLPIDVHNLIDMWFKKKFGVKARSKSVFATFDYGTADFYGLPYLIFPIGNYKTIHSDKVIDLYSIYSTIRRNIIHTTDYDSASYEDKLLIKKSIMAELNKSNYTDKFEFTNSEIMLACKEYYLVDYKHNYNLHDKFTIK